LVYRDNRLVGKDNAARGASRMIGVGAPVSNAQGSVPLNGDDEGFDSHTLMQGTAMRIAPLST
jgi:hypothetical protein